MIEPEIWTIKMGDHPRDDFVRLSAYKALDLQKAELMAENARLQAEVERLRLQVGTDAIDREHGMCCDSSAENARLKAEVGLLKHKLGRLLGAEQEWELVEPGDYARLQAEVERLRASSFVTAVPVEEYDKLKTEVERLRKAGDAMARIIAPPTHGTGEWDGEWDAWNAAKEGKQP